MKLIDQNNQPINDPSTLQNVEPATACAQDAVDELNDAARQDATAVAFHEALPPISGTTAADDQAGGDPAEEAGDSKLSRRDYLIARLRHMQERISSYEQQTLGQGKVSLTLMSAAVSLGLAADHAAELPDDWKPVRTAAPSAEMAVGSRVVIRNRFRKVYQDDLSEEAMDSLVVDRIGEKRLRCKTPGGALVLIPSGHVDLV
jgi:hypothetical protein